MELQLPDPTHPHDSTIPRGVIMSSYPSSHDVFYPIATTTTTLSQQQQQQQLETNKSKKASANRSTTSKVIGTSSFNKSTDSQVKKKSKKSNGQGYDSSQTPTTKKQSKPKSAVPATIPTVFTNDDGVEYIKFTYSVKGQMQNYTIRTGDIDAIDLETLPHEFKLANCVYPRAFCSKDDYSGNRWGYETTVNVLGWKLCWANPEELCGRRGLIQRAVDSYRNRFPEMRSRRVVRQEKLVNGTLRKRSEKSGEFEQTQQSHPSHGEGIMSSASSAGNLKSRILNPHSPSQETAINLRHKKRRIDSEAAAFNRNNIIDPSTFSVSASADAVKRNRNAMILQDPNYRTPVMAFETIVMSAPIRHQIRVDVDLVDVVDMPEEFKLLNSVFPRVHSTPLSVYTLGPPARWHYENNMNVLGWKLAWLNPALLNGRKGVLQRALDAFKVKYRHHPLLGDDEACQPRAGKRVAFKNCIVSTGRYSDNLPTNGILNELNPDEAFALEAAANGLLAVADAMDKGHHHTTEPSAFTPLSPNPPAYLSNDTNTPPHLTMEGDSKSPVIVNSDCKPLDTSVPGGSNGSDSIPTPVTPVMPAIHENIKLLSLSKATMNNISGGDNDDKPLDDDNDDINKPTSSLNNQEGEFSTKSSKKDCGDEGKSENTAAVALVSFIQG